MLDLGTSWLASVARDPDALAIVDGEVRLSYAEWHEQIAGLATGFTAMGLAPGDHLVMLVDLGWEAASIYWAAQLCGLVLVPLPGQTTAARLAQVLDECAGAVLLYQPDAAAAVAAAGMGLARIATGMPAYGEIALADLLDDYASDAAPRVGADAWSVLFYAGEAPMRGVPRRHRAERAAALAHLAHCQSPPGERILGTLSFCEQQGLRDLVACALLGGTFVCLRRFDPASALTLIEAERISLLHLPAAWFRALLSCDEFAEADIGSVRRLCVTSPEIPLALVQRLDAAFRPVRFLAQHGGAEIPLCLVNPDLVAHPGSAGRAGLNQLVRVLRSEATAVDDQAAPGEEGHVIALLGGDDAFEGYWRRPEDDQALIQDGWFATGDIGYFDLDGELYITGPAAPAAEEAQVGLREPATLG